MLGPIGIGAIASSGGAAAGFTGAYDDIPNLVHVYEIARRTLTAYEGNLVRLRRGSDNAEMDFGYDANGDLDTAAITTWLGGASGFVVTVYDQVNGDDVTQATAAAQPLYVASGQGGRPLGRYDAIDDFLRGPFTNGGALSRPINVYAAAKLDTAAGEAPITLNLMDGDDGTNRIILRRDIAGSPDTWTIYSGSLLHGGAADDSWYVWSAFFNGASSQFWLNGVSEAGPGDAGSLTLDGLTIGADRAGSGLWDGDIALIALTDPAHSTAQRQAMEAAINDYYSVF